MGYRTAEVEARETASTEESLSWQPQAEIAPSSTRPDTGRRVTLVAETRWERLAGEVYLPWENLGGGYPTSEAGPLGKIGL